MIYLSNNNIVTNIFTDDHPMRHDDPSYDKLNCTSNKSSSNNSSSSSSSNSSISSSST